MLMWRLLACVRACVRACIRACGVDCLAHLAAVVDQLYSVNKINDALAQVSEQSTWQSRAKQGQGQGQGQGQRQGQGQGQGQGQRQGQRQGPSQNKIRLRPLNTLGVLVVRNCWIVCFFFCFVVPGAFHFVAVLVCLFGAFGSVRFGPVRFGFWCLPSLSASTWCPAATTRSTRSASRCSPRTRPTFC